MPNYYITEGYSKMKITKSQIKKIIQEEIENLMREVEGIHSREVTQLLDDPSTFTRKTAGGAFDLARSFPGSPYGGAGNQAWYQRNTDKLDQGPEDKSGFVVSPTLPPMTHKEFTAARERGDAVAGSATKAYGKPGRLGVLTPDLKKALRSMKDRVLGSTASKTKGTEKPLSPLEYDPKKHALEENDLDKTDIGPIRDGKIRPVAKIVPAPKGRVEEPKRFIVKDNPSAGIYTKDVDPPEPGLPGMPYQREMPSDHPERSILQTDPKNMEPVYKAPKYVERFKPLPYDPDKHRTKAQKRMDMLRAFKAALKESLDEGEKLKLNLPPVKTPKVSYGTVATGLGSALKQLMRNRSRGVAGLADDVLSDKSDKDLAKSLQDKAKDKAMASTAGRTAGSIAGNIAAAEAAKLRKKYSHALPKLMRNEEVEPIPRKKVPHVHMIEEDVVSVKDLDIDETSNKARREEQVNETGETSKEKKRKTVEKSINYRRKTPADKERRKNDAAYIKGLKRRKNKFARQPAKK